MRQNASSAREYDKKFDFSCPDARGEQRTASHRYLPADASVSPTSQRSRAQRAAEPFSAADFKPRWWRTHDVWR